MDEYQLTDDLLRSLASHVEVLEGLQYRWRKRFLPIDEDISRMWELYGRALKVITRIHGLCAVQCHLAPTPSLDADTVIMQFEIDLKRPDLLAQVIEKSISESAARLSGLTAIGIYVSEGDIGTSDV